MASRSEGHDPGRARRAAVRRRRLVALAAVTLASAAAIAAWRTHGASDRPDATAAGAIADRTRSRIVTTRSRVPLAAPLSGETVVPDRGRLLVLGGLDAANQSASGVFRLDGATGRLSPAGTLAQPLHDAAGAVLGSRVLVLGGGSSQSTDAVESIGQQSAGQVVGRLPTPRSDLAAVTLGGKLYVVGGYDGLVPSPEVLRTSDGRRFATVARLPVPVRYPAVATEGRTIYVFGGQTATGASTDAIQAIDSTTGRASVVGHLPKALAHASAIALGGRIYLLGGAIGSGPTALIVGFDPSSARASVAGRLPVPITNAAAATLGHIGYLVGGIGSGGSPLRSVIAIRLQRIKPASPAAPTAAGKSASHRTPPFVGRLLIADRGNNRLLVVDARKRVLWRYPGPRQPPKGGFYFPDDAFFTRRGRGIISNEEENETIVELDYPSGRLPAHSGIPA